MDALDARRWLLVGVAASLGGCQRTPLTYMVSAGAANDPIVLLGWGLTIVSCMVIAIVSLLVLWAIFRRRTEPASPDEIGGPKGGMRWIYIGTGISTVVLFVCATWSVVVLARVATAPRPPKITVELIGHQWWWELRYNGDPASRSFKTANELHVPVGQPVEIRLSSADVIHSFWVPQLGGKMDTIPGQTNRMWLQADGPGTYYGQCTEYCGEQHAHMGVVVVAEPADRFASWWNRELANAPEPSGLAAQGHELFLRNCATCHTIRGTPAGGILGPDLSHVASRARIPSGVLPNTPANLSAWIAHPQAVKPGALMPDSVLNGQQLQAVVAYLEILK